MRDVAREATRTWFTSICDAALQQRGEEGTVAREKVLADVRRRNSIEMAEEFFFLAGLSAEAREHWTSLCGLGVISPWDPVTRQTRYLLRARKAGEANLREQQARAHDAHFGRSHEHPVKQAVSEGPTTAADASVTDSRKRCTSATPSPPAGAKAALSSRRPAAGPRRALRTPHEGREGAWPRSNW